MRMNNTLLNTVSSVAFSVTLSLTVMGGVMGVTALSPVSTAYAATATDTAAQSKAFVDDVAKQALDTIQKARDKKITNAKAKADFRQILNDRFDVPTIAKFTLGKYWRVATEAERKEFVRLIQVTILDKYADRMLEYSGDGFRIGQASIINDKDSAVTMTVLPKGQSPVDFAMRLRKSGKDSFKIIDIAVEGISMSVTHRSDFANVIERNGGQVKALIDALKNKEFSK